MAGEIKIELSPLGLKEEDRAKIREEVKELAEKEFGSDAVSVEFGSVLIKTQGDFGPAMGWIEKVSKNYNVHIIAFADEDATGGPPLRLEGHKGNFIIKPWLTKEERKCIEEGVKLAKKMGISNFLRLVKKATGLDKLLD